MNYYWFSSMYMPHLSPMNWITAITSLTLILLISMSTLWWNTNLQFKQLKSLKLQAKSKWTW